LSLKPISSPTMPAFLLWSPGSNWWGSRANTPEISWNGPRPYRNEGFLKWRYPQIIQSRPFSYENHLKPMVLGIHFRKPPNGPKDVFVFPMKPWFRFLQWGMRCIVNINLVGGLEHFLFFQILGIIIPTDFHIFQRGRYTTNQKMWGWLHTISPYFPIVNHQPVQPAMNFWVMKVSVDLSRKNSSRFRRGFHAESMRRAAIHRWQEGAPRGTRRESMDSRLFLKQIWNPLMVNDD
jgi:hypothetical protein